MAISAAVQWEVRQGGSDTNGGGFKAGATGTDWSLQNAPQYSVTDGVTAGTTTITSATANFGADVVGNIIYVQGGTGAVVGNWYEITVRNSATSITVDRTGGLTAGTGVTLHIGGAMATPGVFSGMSAALQLQNGHKIKWKYNASPYACSTSTPGPGGPFVPPAVALYIQGYDLVPGDNTGNKPTYQWTTAPGSNTFAVTLNGSSRQQIENCSIDCNTQVNASGLSMNTRHDAINCLISNATQSGTSGYGTSGTAISCRSNNCLVGFNALVACSECEAIGTTGQTGFNAVSSSLNRCLARGMATGFTPSTMVVRGCTADGCTTAGFAAGTCGYVDCLATNCTGAAVGFATGGSFGVSLTNCACYNNTTNVSGTPLSNTGTFASGNTITSLGADPYVSQATADYRPNNNNPGGGQIRGLGIGVYGQTDNVDIGALQHADPAGGGTTVFSGEF